jgi:hypothetical protein
MIIVNGNQPQMKRGREKEINSQFSSLRVYWALQRLKTYRTSLKKISSIDGGGVWIVLSFITQPASMLH